MHAQEVWRILSRELFVYVYVRTAPPRPPTSAMNMSDPLCVHDPTSEKPEWAYISGGHTYARAKHSNPFEPPQKVYVCDFNTPTLADIV